MLSDVGWRGRERERGCCEKNEQGRAKVSRREREQDLLMLFAICNHHHRRLFPSSFSLLMPMTPPSLSHPPMCVLSDFSCCLSRSLFAVSMPMPSSPSTLRVSSFSLRCNASGLHVFGVIVLPVFGESLAFLLCYPRLIFVNVFVLRLLPLVEARKSLQHSLLVCQTSKDSLDVGRERRGEGKASVASGTMTVCV